MLSSRLDALEIKGDRYTDSPMPTMTAIEVKKGDDTLILRDDDGFPMWRASLRQWINSRL